MWCSEIAVPSHGFFYTQVKINMNILTAVESKIKGEKNIDVRQLCTKPLILALLLIENQIKGKASTALI